MTKTEVWNRDGVVGAMCLDKSTSCEGASCFAQLCPAQKRYFTLFASPSAKDRAQQVQKAWDDEQLAKSFEDFVRMQTSPTCCLGWCRSFAKEAEFLEPLLTQEWLPSTNAKLAKHGLAADVLVWAHQEHGEERKRSDTCMVRFWDATQRVDNAAALHTAANAM
mmetsp:Transcript_1393/g.2786  ORF Transcript_1393/g.2786 Transcript_1393/m.2786 type:complete len:164 (+) Transcript_1393:165-656(+)|eukprot:CAMPEP_0181291004 /NCGR_PEP_ID=MMETSP1101-20121128/1723_1 /TAXON_ID=46948 /ORGANISM="Rhodomonas abbreviata, Strain Caron Lab Isolate" /LENGTH=163 /DNA_ID=CAMNT_0023395341 /DNA_START=160 /DNA_END=651 /DNA_ORIENTATION=-